MLTIRFNVLIALALVGWWQSASSSESFCATGEVSPIKLRVTVRPEQRQDFIRYLESDREPFALGASYVGGAESSGSLSIDFLQIFDEVKASTITVEAENKKPSFVFDFSFWSCNTTRSLKPYRDAVRRRATQFGVVSVVKIVSK